MTYGEELEQLDGKIRDLINRRRAIVTDEQWDELCKIEQKYNDAMRTINRLDEWYSQ